MKNPVVLVVLTSILTLSVMAGLITGAPQRELVVNTQLGGDFSLRTADGQVSLSQFRGDVVLIYFGYTFCPDICPTSLAVMRQAFDQLSVRDRERVHGLFVSVDPQRDTLPHLKSYASFFSDRIIGMTGTQDEIDKVVRQYGAFYRLVKLEDSAMTYTVDHSSRIYLVGRNGGLLAALPHDTDPSVLTEKIQSALNRE